MVISPVSLKIEMFTALKFETQVFAFLEIQVRTVFDIIGDRNRVESNLISVPIIKIAVFSGQVLCTFRTLYLLCCRR